MKSQNMHKGNDNQLIPAPSAYALSLSGTGVKVSRLVLTIRMAPIGSALAILCAEPIGKDG
jgi:hypothetical protein